MSDSACLKDVNRDTTGHMHAKTRRAPSFAAASLLLAFACSAPAAADELTYNADGLPAASIATSLLYNADLAAVRKSMAERGVTYNFLYTNDILANIRGGEKRGTTDLGRLEASIAIDLGKLAGFNGLQFYSNALEIHNTGRIRRDYVGGINTISSLEVRPATRLSELWLEQKLWDGRASLRLGQLTADTEFFVSGINALFLQGGWPTIAAANMPSGGPAFPLSTPGIRLKTDPSEQVSLLLAMFNGDPAGPGPGDEQIRNRHGLNFRIADPPLVIAEAQHRANQGKDPEDDADQGDDEDEVLPDPADRPALGAGRRAVGAPEVEDPGQDGRPEELRQGQRTKQRGGHADGDGVGPGRPGRLDEVRRACGGQPVAEQEGDGPVEDGQLEHAPEVDGRRLLRSRERRGQPGEDGARDGGEAEEGEQHAEGQQLALAAGPDLVGRPEQPRLHRAGSPR